MRSRAPRKTASPAAYSSAAAPPSEPSTPTTIVSTACGMTTTLSQVVPGRPGERDAGGDHADVTERLREVAAELTRGRIDLLGQQPERARSGAEGRIELGGVL